MAIGMSVPRNSIEEGPCEKNQLLLQVALISPLIIGCINVFNSSLLQDLTLVSCFLAFVSIMTARFCFEFIYRQGTMDIVPIFVYKSIFNRSKS
mgnify:CR=1 FL=1|jgi:hypothetical protein